MAPHWTGDVNGRGQKPPSMQSVANTSEETAATRGRDLPRIRRRSHFPQQLREHPSSLLGFNSPLLVASEPGAICMSWHFISMMISGSAEDLSESGPRGFPAKVISVMRTSH